ncbi:MAG TPA: thiamine pyrophosphate-dependent enzyme, partial [Chloroflexota bacterium]
EEYIQRYDQPRFAEACEALYVRLLSSDHAYEAVRKAFYLAKTESQPVLLGAAMDIQQQNMDDDEEYRPSSSMFSSVPAAPNPAAMEQAAEIVEGSRKPVIVVGRGAMWADAGQAVVSLAERIGAIIATTLMAKTWLCDADQFHVGISGFYGTRTAMQLFEDADAVIAVGASMNRYTTEHGYIFPNARYVQLELKPQALMGDGKAADCYIHTDARLGVEALEAALAKRSFQQTGYRTPEVKKRLETHFEDTAQFEVESDRLDPREVCIALDDLVPDDVALVTGSGASTGFSNILFHRPRPLVMAGHWFGCIGQQLPAAMGAVAATKRPTLLVDGDASLLMHVAELETAVRANMPLLVVCLNDQALGSEYHKFHAHKMDAELATIPTPDLGAVGRALGGRGTLATTIEDVGAAAQEWLADRRGLMVIDARISRKVVSLPYRRIHFGKDE